MQKPKHASDRDNSCRRPNQNAYDSYQKVLELDDDNDKATLGLRTLAKTVESSANEALSRGDTATARSLVEQASRVFPNDLGIQYLRETLSMGSIDTTVVTTPVDTDPDPDPDTDNGLVTDNTTSNDVNVDSAEVTSLITRADNYFDQNIMSFPPGKNAMDLYLEVIALDPDNQRANDQLEYIANMWALTAEGKIKEGEMTMARRMIDRGLKARPQSPQAAGTAGRYQLIRVGRVPSGRSSERFS